jgi:Flp pilus assembly protein TadD
MSIELRPAAVLLALLLVSACGSGSHSSRAQFDDASRLRVAQAAEASGDDSLAESVYANVAAAEPANTEAQLHYADVLMRQSKISQARDVLAKHMATVSHPEQLRGGLGAIYLLQGEPAKAIVEFDAVLSREPRWTVNKAIALDLLKRHDEAQALYRKALADDPDDVVVINNLTLSLLLSGRTEEAAKVATVLANRTDLPARVKAVIGVLTAARGDLPGARAISGNSDDVLRQFTVALNQSKN